MEEIWFGDTPQWMEPTISQFLDAIEGNENWNENDKKTFALTHLKGAAEVFSQRHFQSDMDWNTIKVKLFEQFKCHVNIWDKVEMQRNLTQSENESVRDFYNRCVSYQYIFCDDYGELVLDNDIMINFLHGMNRTTYNSLYERLSLTENVLDLNTCLNEAEVIETEMTNSDHNDPTAFGDETLLQDHHSYHQNGNYVPQEEQFEYNPTPIVKRENPNFKTEPQTFSGGISATSNMAGPSAMMDYQIPAKKAKQTIKSESNVFKKEFHNNDALPVISNIASMTDLNSPTTKRQGKASEGFDKKPDGKVECLQCGKLFSRMDKAKNHAIKTHEPDQAIECPLCKNYYAKNKIDWNEHVKKVHQMSPMDMKNIQIVYSSFNPMDPILAKRPDGKVACLKCIDELGCHKTYSRMDKAKAHFGKQHGPI